MICTIKKEREFGMVRSVVLVHETPAREVHASPWCSTWERARSHAERYAKRNSITVAYSD